MAAKKRILLIEDNEPNRVLETDLLEAGGFEVFTATDAACAVAAARKEMPDLIIMDLRLPDMPGTRLAEILKEDPVLRGIPVVFVTADIAGTGGDELNYSGYKYFSKPIDPLTFAVEIRKQIK